MNFCTNCGAELEVGRFCTNCGAPVRPAGEQPTTYELAGDLEVDATMERTAVHLPPTPYDSDPSASPPPVLEPHTSARYPLYADELVPTSHRAAPARRGSSVWVIALILGMLVAGSTGVWLATRGDDDGSVTGTESPSGSSPGDGSSSPDAGEVDEADDLAPHSRVSAPPPVRPSRDLQNRLVRYPASNMLDDDPETAWRTGGDATGEVITFRLPQATAIKAVGLINGYAKRDETDGGIVDWYPRNRRILQVKWVFDDGTEVVQGLRENAELQTIAVDVTSRKIELHLLEVSAPGGGGTGKNVTAISDVFIGS